MRRDYSLAAGSCASTTVGNFAAANYMPSKACPAGTYANATGMTKCTVCPANSSCTTSAATGCASPNTKSGAGVGSCLTVPTGAVNSSYGYCSSGQYSTSATTGCTNCPINVQCKSTSYTTSACPTTEKPLISGTTYTATAFYATLGQGTCHHVPVGSFLSSGALAPCAATSFGWNPVSATCLTTCTSGACNVALPPGVTTTCQLTQYFDNTVTGGQCKNCNQATYICDNPYALNASQKIVTPANTVTLSSSTPTTQPGDGKAQAEGVPYGACLYYGTDK